MIGGPDTFSWRQTGVSGPPKQYFTLIEVLTMADSSNVQCVIVTPERAVLDENVDFVALPMYDGELGVLPGRSPLIGRLGYGELRTRRGSETRRFFIDGGFAQIRANVVTVLTPHALRAEEINVDVVTRDLEKAKGVARTPEEQAAHWRDQQRARAQITVARHAQEKSAH
jgi:F-type H+-transporting ATPase subunit epsilon